MYNGIMLWIFMGYLPSVRAAGEKVLFKTVTSRYWMLGHGLTLAGG